MRAPSLSSDCDALAHHLAHCVLYMYINAGERSEVLAGPLSLVFFVLKVHTVVCQKMHIAQGRSCCSSFGE